MQIGDVDIEWKPGAARLANTGLRYVGYGTLVAVGWVITALTCLTEYTGKGLSWLQVKRLAFANSLIEEDALPSDDINEDAVEGEEVPQTRIDEQSASEQQADADFKQEDDLRSTSEPRPVTIGELVEEYHPKFEREVTSEDKMAKPAPSAEYSDEETRQ